MKQNIFPILDGLSDLDKIVGANATLVSSLSQEKQSNEEIFYRGVLRKVWYFEENKFWWGNFSESDYFWNIFGFGEIESPSKFTEICNVNYFKGGKESKHAGLFAKDGKDNIYLIHNGTFRNGSLPVSENEFLSTIVDVRINTIPYKYFLVAKLSSKSLHEDIFRFVKGVSDFKGHLQSVKNTPDTSSIML